MWVYVWWNVCVVVVVDTWRRQLGVYKMRVWANVCVTEEKLYKTVCLHDRLKVVDTLGSTISYFFAYRGECIYVCKKKPMQ